MGRHWTEDRIFSVVRAFATDVLRLRDLRAGDGEDPHSPDATARQADGRVIAFEIKAAQVAVIDRSHTTGKRPGRWRIDPAQHSSYGTDRLWYVLVVYDRDHAEEGRILEVRFIRSDFLPRRRTVLSLPPSRVPDNAIRF